MARRWNHNTHYHRVVLDAVPHGARTALDVGTGNGLLAADLHRAVPDVVGIDLDEGVLASARGEDAAVRWVLGDVLTRPFAPGSFDVVASVATLHHLPDPAAAFRRFAELTAPGGVVAVVGVARASRPVDALVHLAGAVQHAVLARRYGYWEHSAPTVWPPPHTYAEVRDTARAALPGCRWRRLPLWRYAVVWNRPAPRPGRLRSSHQR
ncbi:class I SAM-dependent methyltransferase [Pseudonocardia broussonetiae]|uniref:class I SAM-dependent methyltransferase n=1 Tax=Pseudonocardia broussonetiae TaxID=2736640 RepID=UPI00196690AA|nr:class I SAM-dependent methyltransferase [Pseudonocardia broussonetiae]